MKTEDTIERGTEDRARLEELIKAPSTPQKHVWRARIVLLTADGLGVSAIARRTAKSRPTVRRWQTRFMAGISLSSVQRIWRGHGLKPHLTRTFKLPNDPRFAEKVKDIVGLYFDPPDKALVLSVNEKSQILALDRTQPELPRKKGRAGTMTHDYKRNGTAKLFAALNMLDGTVIGQCMKRHRHQEFIRFLNCIDRETLPRLDIHLIIDNYGAHKTPAVKRWLKRCPRFHIHFTPTSASWLNMVERFFAEITRKRIRRGVFKSVEELETAIDHYLEHHNENPNPSSGPLPPIRSSKKSIAGNKH
jgi:transposase